MGCSCDDGPCLHPRIGWHLDATDRYDIPPPDWFLI
jgi:hypothetical protein